MHGMGALRWLKSRNLDLLALLVLGWCVVMFGGRAWIDAAECHARWTSADATHWSPLDGCKVEVRGVLVAESAAVIAGSTPPKRHGGQR